MTAILPMLSRVRLFSSFSADELAALSLQMRSVSFSRNQTIFHQGDNGDTLFIIAGGLVKISSFSKEGKEAILAILGEGDIFGELAVLDQQSRSASATAIEPVAALALKRDSFLSFLKTYPAAAIQTAVSLADRLRQTDGIVADAVFLDVPARIAKRLLELSAGLGHSKNASIQVPIPLTQSELAGLTGTVRQSVNRVLANWQDAGLIRLDKRGILILDPDELQKRYL